MGTFLGSCSASNSLSGLETPGLAITTQAERSKGEKSRIGGARWGAVGATGASVVVVRRDPRAATFR